MASAYTLEFEKPLLELERQIDELKRLGSERQIDIDDELDGLEGKLESLRAEIYRNLTPIQRVRSPAIPAAPTRSTISAPSSPTSSSCTATASSWTTRRSSAAGRGSTA